MPALRRAQTPHLSSHGFSPTSSSLPSLSILTSSPVPPNSAGTQTGPVGSSMSDAPTANASGVVIDVTTGLCTPESRTKSRWRGLTPCPLPFICCLLIRCVLPQPRPSITPATTFPSALLRWSVDGVRCAAKDQQSAVVDAEISMQLFARMRRLSSRRRPAATYGAFSL